MSTKYNDNSIVDFFASYIHVPYNLVVGVVVVDACHTALMSKLEPP